MKVVLAGLCMDFLGRMGQTNSHSRQDTSSLMNPGNPAVQACRFPIQ